MLCNTRTGRAERSCLEVVPQAGNTGLVGGGIWHLAQIDHVEFQIGMANYNKVYSSFAAIPIFLVWVQVSWMTVMIGAEMAYAHQNEPAYRRIARERGTDRGFRQFQTAEAGHQAKAVLYAMFRVVRFEIFDKFRIQILVVGWHAKVCRALEYCEVFGLVGDYGDRLNG